MIQGAPARCHRAPARGLLLRWVERGAERSCCPAAAPVDPADPAAAVNTGWFLKGARGTGLPAIGGRCVKGGTRER